MNRGGRFKSTRHRQAMDLSQYKQKCRYRICRPLHVRMFDFSRRSDESQAQTEESPVTPVTPVTPDTPVLLSDPLMPSDQSVRVSEADRRQMESPIVQQAAASVATTCVTSESEVRTGELMYYGSPITPISRPSVTATATTATTGYSDTSTESPGIEINIRPLGAVLFDTAGGMYTSALPDYSSGLPDRRNDWSLTGSSFRH